MRHQKYPPSWIKLEPSLTRIRVSRVSVDSLAATVKTLANERLVACPPLLPKRSHSSTQSSFQHCRGKYRSSKEWPDLISTRPRLRQWWSDRISSPSSRA